MDAGYGTDTDLRTNITALGLSYVAGIQPQASVWAPGTGPQPPKTWSGCGRPPKLLRRDGEHQPVSVKKLAFGLPSRAWRKITWREATAQPLTSRFARVRVRAAHRDYWRAESRPEEWLLIEWPEDEKAPTKYWFSTLPANIAFRQLVDTANALSATTTNLNRRLALATSKGGVGAASIITPRCASRPMDS
jgi:SRSO17 transposase